ncbi:hypothetical protein L598_003400000200 [Mesorhizobium sp. J18]|uniref:hypothetical protein n=1 Tax=Mesorhizobium sp. J18 TaxID=935263 RepID=UPI00119AB5CA|nr:hypothetical protein [Mesorhizobium sp. J18]TWG94758.1 hypothetical protein L598_003400000200 [Mesorhizobium sp. J18]
MSAGAAVSTGAAEIGQSERRWRRRSLWALLILLPATLALGSYTPVKWLFAAKDLFPRDVEPGSTVRFGGSDWKLEAMLTTKDTGSVKLPENAVPVFVDFSVTIGDPDLQKLWTGCRITLADAAGRSWLPTSLPILRYSDDWSDCNSATFSGAAAGATLKIREAFVVPKDAIPTIEPTLGLGSERPYYLRFLRAKD